jgi:hypothetical protein
MRSAAIAGFSIPSVLGRHGLKTDRLLSFGLTLSVVLLFGVSGGMLWLFGYNYNAITGSAFTKIHPFSYLIVILFVRQAMLSGSPLAYALRIANRRPAGVLMAFAALLLFAVSVMRKTPGMAGTIDTFFVPALLVMMMVDADERTLARMTTALHVLMTLNALIALFEFVTKTQLFPYRFDGALLVGDTRSTALQGHPLTNAFVTACYVMALMSGARSLSTGLKLTLIALQCAALVTFGGRTATVVTLILGAFYAIVTMLRTMRSGRVSLRGAAIALLLLAFVPLAVGGLADGGFFNALFERFVSDGGSANARVEMFAMFKAIPLHSLVIGPDISLVDSLRRMNGLESGIENPFVSMTLYHGAFLTVLIFIALGLMLFELTRDCHRGVWLPMLAFLILLNASESIATKTTAVAKFAIILLCMYRARPAGSSARRH